MAESLIVVGAKNAHTFNRTIGANSVEDEVIILGEPYLASYIVTGTASIATAASHVVQVMAGATLNVYVRRIIVTQLVAATTAAFLRWQLYRLTTAGTGGTAITPGPLDSTDAPAGATGMSIPTVKGTESTLIIDRSCNAIQTISLGGPGQSTTLLDIDFDRMHTKGYRIAAGTTNGIALKNVTAIAAGTVEFEVWISEANF